MGAPAEEASAIEEDNLIVAVCIELGRLNGFDSKLNGSTQRLKSAFHPMKSGHSTALRLKTPKGLLPSH